MKFIFYVLVCFFIDGCAKSPNAEANVTMQSILGREHKLDEIYFSGDIEPARVALMDYIAYLNDFDLATEPIQIARLIHSGKSLAMARLEFINAYKENRTVDLSAAADEMRLMGGEMSQLDKKQMVAAIKAMIRDDSKFVSWVNETHWSTGEPEVNRTSQPRHGENQRAK